MNLQRPEAGERVRIINPKYGLIHGLDGMVSDDNYRDFKVDLGQFEVVISKPETDLEPLPLDITQIGAAFDTLLSLLPPKTKFEVKPSGTIVVNLTERVLRRSFPEFEYSVARWGQDRSQFTIRLTATFGEVEFVALASKECLAEAEAWIAAHPETEPATA